MRFKTIKEYDEWYLNMMADVRIDKRLDSHLEICNEILEHYEYGITNDMYDDDEIERATKEAINLRDYKNIIVNKLDYFEG